MVGMVLLSLSRQAGPSSGGGVLRCCCALLWAAPTLLNVVNLIREGRPSVGMVPLSVASLACVCLAESSVRTLACVVLIPSVACSLIVCLWCARLARAARRVDVPTDACVICLGGAVVGGRPRPTLANRLDRCAELLRTSGGRCAIVSGASPDEGARSEAQVMRDYLVARGIDGSRIHREDEARTTRENLSRSLALAHELGIVGPFCVCTSDYHLYRALTEAERLGVAPVPAAARTPALSAPQQWCREVLTVIATFGPL